MSTLKTKGQITVKNRDGTIYYQTGKLLGENDKFRMYEASSSSYVERSLILKISVKKEYNYLLEREAFLLDSMSEVSAQVDKDYAEKHDGNKLNYQIGFPKLLDNFISNDQDNRRILILSLEINCDLSKIVPINLIRIVDKVRIDPKTSVWILGKLLKIIAFAHDQLFATVGNLDSENIFIVKENHLITIFDWSKAITNSLPVAEKIAMGELRQAVKAVIILLGGDPETGSIPDHEQLQGEGARYHELLESLLVKDFTSVYDAHRYFYEVVEEIWERKYHPYSTIPIED